MGDRPLHAALEERVIDRLGFVEAPRARRAQACLRRARSRSSKSTDGGARAIFLSPASA